MTNKHVQPPLSARRRFLAIAMLGAYLVLNALLAAAPR